MTGTRHINGLYGSVSLTCSATQQTGPLGYGNARREAGGPRETAFISSAAPLLDPKLELP